MAVDVILGFEVHPRPLEVGQDRIIKGDVGLPGVEQDPIAIKGNQFDQTICPGIIGVQAVRQRLILKGGNRNLLVS